MLQNMGLNSRLDPGEGKQRRGRARARARAEADAHKDADDAPRPAGAGEAAGDESFMLKKTSRFIPCLGTGPDVPLYLRFQVRRAHRDRAAGERREEVQ